MVSITPHSSKAWFDQSLAFLSSSSSIFATAESRLLHKRWQTHLDNGALRTMQAYCGSLDKTAFMYLARRYYLWYYDEQRCNWVDRNPSACLVSMLRFSFFCDNQFKVLL